MERTGDLLAREAFDLSQDEDRAVLEAQPQQSLLDAPGALAAPRLVERAALVAPVGE